MENVVPLEEYVGEPGDQVFIISDNAGWVVNGSDIPGVGYHILPDVYILPTHDTDCVEPVNDILDEHANPGSGEAALLEPMLFYGEYCDITKLIEQTYSEYLLFVPSFTGNRLDGYHLYFVGELELLVLEIETCLKNRSDLEINDLAVFRGEAVELVWQITPYFDQAEIEETLKQE